MIDLLRIEERALMEIHGGDFGVFVEISEQVDVLQVHAVHSIERYFSF